MRERLAWLMVLCAAVLAFAAPSEAQVFTGRIDVTATDATGAILPGVAVDIAGPRAASAVTDANGEARFLNLPPGTYTVSANLSGFGPYVNKNVPVVAGAIVPLRVTLSVGGVATQVDVTAATPTIDPKRLTTTTNVTNDELQQVPSSRDPWVVLQTVPGIIVDRVNVGGAESGQQSSYQAKGAAGGDNTWNIDGIPITDMSALGSSPTYYDFDMFQEMNVTTGGADVTNPTPGVSLNFVLKGGSNTPHGSARYYYENERMQANNLPDDLKASLGGKTGKGNRMDAYYDTGFELGGPIWRDKLWAWGAFGKTDVTVRTLSDTTDQTILENYSFKGTGQVSQALRGSFTYFRGDKLKFGRGASPTRPDETTWNQSGPTQLYKGEANVVISNNLFLTGRYAYVDGGFRLAPRGGLETGIIYDDSGTWRGSYYDYSTTRPQKNGQMEGNYFRGNHELKFGFGYRIADVDSTYIVPGGGIVSYHAGYPNMSALATAYNQFTGVTGRYASAFASDTITWDRLTLQLGLRWDRQSSSVNGYTQLGNPNFPTLLPDLKGIAAEDAVVWNSVTPRLGVTYALTDDRKTIGRASYATFAQQMNAGQGGFLSVAGNFRWVYFYDVLDANGNRMADVGELAGRSCGPADIGVSCVVSGFNINNPGNVSEPIHKVGDYSTPTTHEFIVGLDRELMTNFGVSANVTWRRFTDFNWRVLPDLRSDDYVLLGNFTGDHAAVGNYSVPVYGVPAANRPASTTATVYSDREGYSQRFLGFELSATKRLSNRWMARFGFSSNDHREYFDGAESRQDPTPTPGNPNVDGGLVMRQTGGSGKSGIYMLLPQYQFILTGMYQAPWGINLAANMVNRQGYSTPYFRTLVDTRAVDPSGLGDVLTRNKTVLLVDDVGDRRLPAVTSLDVRLGKEFAIRRARINLDLDVFNALNSATVLGRQYDLRVSTANNVQEIMNPRILRLGLRFNF